MSPTFALAAPWFSDVPPSLLLLRSRSRRLALGCLAAIGGLLPRGAEAQVVELRAILDAAQEVPATTSPATGTGLMLYHVATNTFDLYVTLNRYANVMTDSHVQEAPAGVNGPALIHFGAESVFSRTGSTVTAAFLQRPYPGDPRKLLQGGAYLNFHSGPFPRGEVRGQLISQPKRLVAALTVAQEQAAFPAQAISSGASGAAVMVYDPSANRVSLRLSLFHFTNALTNSHYHEGAPGVSGPVVVALGAGTAGDYTNHGDGHWTGTFDLPYEGGDALKLLSGSAYLNFHSNLFPGGELRGQVLPSEESPATRFANVAARGIVGPGAQALIAGLTIAGPEPARVLITAKGPSLAAFGVTGFLADPVLTLFDSAGRQLATNDNLGVVLPGSELGRLPGVPGNPTESVLLLVLPPGTYSAVVTGGGGGTGIALLEAIDLRGHGVP